ncbi:anti-sigma factor family protein [Tepidibacillus fermentans]|uniref:Anti-sigma-W factor RsiW n=1 Tax=Tepidibacillus fermentans TaxID=1281767 RepID=A0A4R3KDA1_9BACI|nr:zf-HC2 domain-containing protein [Tepidibacillus fermentans]TCS81254.1 putative zinc finger protein [Tepidibacillus fermentans]
MNHPDVELISAYVDDELEVFERNLIEEHLMSCENCLELYNDLKKMKELITLTYRSIQIPQDLEQKIMERINQGETEIPLMINKIPWLQFILPLFVISLLITSQPLILSFGIISSVTKVLLSIIPVVIHIVPYLLGVIIFLSLIAILFSIWSLRRLMVKKAYY